MPSADSGPEIPETPLTELEINKLKNFGVSDGEAEEFAETPGAARGAISDLEEQLKGNIPNEIEIPTFISAEKGADAQIEEVQKELEKMPEEEREKIGLGFSNMGYWVEEKKNGLYSRIFNKVAEKGSEDGTLQRFFGALGANAEKKATDAHKKMEEIEGGNGGVRKQMGNVGYLSGNAIKYGRTIGDIVGFTAGSPFRYVMLGAQTFTRGIAASREARLQNKEVAEKTKVADEERAAEEAWSLYEEAKEANGGEIPNGEALSKMYRENLPEDLLSRLERNSDTGVMSFLGSILRKDIEFELIPINNRLIEIEEDDALSPEQKEAAKEKILAKMEDRLHDYDRMISDAGNVDALAMGARYAETAGKTVVGAMMVESVALAAKSIWEHAGHMFAGTEHAVKEAVAPRPLAAQTLPQGAAGQSMTAASTAGAKAALESAQSAPHGFTDASTAGAKAALEAAQPEVHGLEGGNLEANEAVSTVKEGGNMWKTAHELVTSGKISRAEFEAAWNNHLSGAEIHGEHVQIDHLGMVHAGDQVRFIPGENGTPGHFEVHSESGVRMGSDAEYAKIVQSHGHDLPKWLADSTHEPQHMGAIESAPAVSVGSGHLSDFQTLDPTLPGVKEIPHEWPTEQTVAPSSPAPIHEVYPIHDSPADVVRDLKFSHGFFGGIKESNIDDLVDKFPSRPGDISDLYSDPKFPQTLDDTYRPIADWHSDKLAFLKKALIGLINQGKGGSKEANYLRSEALKVLAKSREAFGKEIYKPDSLFK